MSELAFRGALRKAIRKAHLPLTRGLLDSISAEYHAALARRRDGAPEPAPEMPPAKRLAIEIIKAKR